MNIAIAYARGLN